VLLENGECERYRGLGEINFEFNTGGGHFEHL
jgi:hypothetical protein